MLAVPMLQWRRLCDDFPRTSGGLQGGYPVVHAAAAPSKDRRSPSAVSPGQERPSLALELVMLQPQKNRPPGSVAQRALATASPVQMGLVGWPREVVWDKAVRPT